MVRERDQARSNVTRAAFRDMARTFPDKTALWNATPHTGPNDLPRCPSRTDDVGGVEALRRKKPALASTAQLLPVSFREQAIRNLEQLYYTATDFKHGLALQTLNA